MYAVALTDIGRQRTINQDCILAVTDPIGPLPNLFVVADGMGGAKAGDYASKSLLSYMLTSIQTSMKAPVLAMREAIAYANKTLYTESIRDKNLSGMGTTVVAATIIENTLYVCNVGDSRLYIIGDTIRQITKDHSLVETLISLGQMERFSTAYKENKSKITRAIGAESIVDIDVFEVDLKENDRILLCSDGLTNMVEDIKIFRIVQSGISLEASVKRLVEEANILGGRDNISVLLIDAGGEVDR